MPVLVFLALLLALPAQAAPTCRDRDGDTIKCGVQGAMPVGWQPPPEILWDRRLSRPEGPGTAEILKVFFGLGVFLALIALLPEFDGSKAGDWDRQEDDGEKRE